MQHRETHPRVLGIDLRANASVGKLCRSMSFTLSFSPFLLVLCGLVAGVLTYWMYHGTTPLVTGLRRGALVGLRFLALFIILFLLFEPIWNRLVDDEQSPILAVLVDDSASLGTDRVHENGDTLRLSAQVRETVQSLPAGQIDGDVRLFRFSRDIASLPAAPVAAADSLTFEAPRKSLSQALESVRERFRDDNLQGVLLVSDGHYNQGSNPLYVSERYPVPIHTVVVGDTTRQRDLQVRRVIANEIGYVDVEHPVQARIRADDVEGETVTISLLQDGNVLDQASLELPEGSAEIPVDLAFTPEEEGLQQLAVYVSAIEGEVTERNNVRSFGVRVLERRSRILLVGAAPTPDLAFLRRLLSLDEDTEVSSFIQRDASSFYEGPFPDTLDDYDMIVLAGYPGASAEAPVLERISDAARDGMPLLFVSSKYTDLSLVEQYLADVLPAAPSATTQARASEARFEPTERGMRHVVFDLPDDVVQFQDRLPPLHYLDSQWSPSPDAQVLAHARTRTGRSDAPVLTVRSRTGQRTAAWIGTGLWHWDNLPEDLDVLSSYAPGLLSNLVEWLAAPQDDRPVRVEPVESMFDGAEAVEFMGEVYDERLQPVSNASVQLIITDGQGSEFPHMMDPIGNGRYALDVGQLPEGTYSYRARAEHDDTELGEDTGSFAVTEDGLDFADMRADATLMRQIALRSGGQYVERSELAGLPQMLSTSGSFEAITYTEEQHTRLWHVPWFLLFVVGLLTTEWFLRKRSGMV